MENKKHKIELISKQNINSYKFINMSTKFNFNNKNLKNSKPLSIKKNSFQSRTYLYKKEYVQLQKIPIINFQKKINFNPKVRPFYKDFGSTLQKQRSSSLINIKSPKKLSQKFQDFFNNKIEQEVNKKKELNNNDNTENDILDSISMEQLKDKINKEYQNVGQLIKVSFVVEDKKTFDYEKNEFVILKIVKNDLKENQGLDVKDFIFQDSKLNMFKSFKDNNIINNSVIKVVL
jgi:hypothetical protein